MSCFEKLKWCFKMDIGKKLIAKYQKKKFPLHKQKWSTGKIQRSELRSNFLKQELGARRKILANNY